MKEGNSKPPSFQFNFERVEYIVNRRLVFRSAGKIVQNQHKIENETTVSW